MEIPNFRHLRAFQEVVKRRSISQAAAAVYLSQPAVTQAIGKIEDLLQIPLFDRLSDGMRPTAAGEAFAHRVGRALELVKAGAAEAQRIAGERGAKRIREVLPLLTTTQLRAFVAVGSASNFSLAARQLGTSQPALHRAARDLEALISTPLFEKTTRGISLTKAGQALFQQVKLAFAEFAQGFAEVASVNGIDAGRVVIGSLPLSRHFVLPEAINAFAARYPGVTVQVTEAPYNELLQGVRYGEIDCMIGALRDPLAVDDVFQEALFSASLCVAARSDHPLVGKKKLAAADLAAYPWVVPARGTPTRDRFDALFAKHKLGLPAGLVESGSLVLIRGLLKTSNRLTLISTHQIRVEQEMGLLTRLSYDLGDTRRDIGVTLRRDWLPTEVQADFLAFLRQAARAYSEN